jgi:hypothetical protein
VVSTRTIKTLVVVAVLIAASGGVWGATWLRTTLRVHHEVIADLDTLELGMDRKTVWRAMRHAPYTIRRDAFGEHWYFPMFPAAASVVRCTFDSNGRLVVIQDDKEHTRSGPSTSVIP